jgi:hypothetical protein
MAKYSKQNLEGRFVQILMYACDYNSSLEGKCLVSTALKIFATQLVKFMC